MNTLCCGLNLKHQSICILPPLMSLVNPFILNNNSFVYAETFLKKYKIKAREMIHSYRIALIFMLMCNLSVCFVQLICNIIFLPPILSGFQVRRFLIVYILKLKLILTTCPICKGHFLDVIYNTSVELFFNSQK